MCGREYNSVCSTFDTVGGASKIYSLNSLSYKPSFHRSLDKSIHIRKAKNGEFFHTFTSSLHALIIQFNYFANHHFSLHKMVHLCTLLYICSI